MFLQKRCGKGVEAGYMSESVATHRATKHEGAVGKTQVTPRDNVVICKSRWTVSYLNMRNNYVVRQPHLPRKGRQPFAFFRGPEKQRSNRAHPPQHSRSRRHLDCRRHCRHVSGSRGLIYCRRCRCRWDRQPRYSPSVSMAIIATRWPDAASWSHQNCIIAMMFVIVKTIVGRWGSGCCCCQWWGWKWCRPCTRRRRCGRCRYCPSYCWCYF